MQFIRQALNKIYQLWKSGIIGKIVVLTGLCTFCFICSLLFAPSSEELAATRTVESIARETEAANATDTPAPTNTPEPTPTLTLTPNPTDTPIPTKPPPTDTPVPTYTPIPTFTPTITPEPTSTPSVNFSSLRRWQPGGPNGYGAEILLEDDLNP